jgi:very-short-patch-repair endonuclease
LEAKAESAFELEVAERLTRLGYKVVPQWRVGHYRIDMVVVGANGKRLAVECDGDRYHPIEKLPDDIARQAVLERLGWTFIRIRGSQFFRDPEGSLAPLLQRLKMMEIEAHIDPDDNSQPSSAPQSDLYDRVVRRAHEILRKWRGPIQSSEQTEASPEHAPPSTSSDRSSGLDSSFEPRAPEVTAYREVADQVGEDDEDQDSEMAGQHSLFGGVRLTKDLSAEEVRAAIHLAVPDTGPVDREVVIRKAAQTLGFVRVSKLFRSRINKTIGAEVRYGRLAKDADWNFIWREKA